MKRTVNPKLQHIEAQDPAYTRLYREVVIAWLIWAVASVVLTLALNVIGLALALVILGALLLRLLLRLYHRQQVEAFYHYRALEAYFSLFSSLRIEHPLPPMRLWRIAPDFAVTLLALIRAHKPALIVEIGSGVSTVIASYALKEQGHGRVISFEHEAAFARVTAEDVAAHGLTAWAEVRHAPLRNLTHKNEDWRWYDLTAFEDLNGIDLLTVDGPPEGTGWLARYPALALLHDRLNPGALVLVDDYLRDDEHEMVERWLNEFDCELVLAEANEKGVAVLRKRG